MVGLVSILSSYGNAQIAYDIGCPCYCSLTIMLKYTAAAEIRS